MDSQTIGTALALLQDDPDDSNAWSTLRAAVEAGATGSDLDAQLKLFAAARRKHQERGEWDAVQSLLELEVQVAGGSGEEAGRLWEQVRTLRDELADDDAAALVLIRLIELTSDREAQTAYDEMDGRRDRWRELEATYVGEAAGAPDDVYRSSMVMRAAEMELRYGGDQMDEGRVLERLEQALRLDATNERAARWLERIYRRSGRFSDAARVLERLAERGEAPVRVAAGIRLGRLSAKHLGDADRAARAFDRVLSIDPERPEANTWLSSFYEQAERWGDLCAMYERNLKGKDLSQPERLGDMMQVAMLHWRKRERADDAEPWFDRIRKLEPASPLVLNFYREHCAATGDDARLLGVLQGAQRAMPDGPEKQAIVAELTKLADAQEAATRQIEQFKSALRTNPDDAEAREALKRLYRQTEGYNALVELLRQQVERTPADQVQERVALLREIARIYRTNLKSDTALVSVLNQIVQQDERVDAEDVAELRELVQLYEKLGRWRDLLTQQQKLAEVTPDLAERQTLYRSAARRWLEQFSNAQNATEAYEALLTLAPDDGEARERLEELYRKRRAWPALFDLFQRQVTSAEGAQRALLLREMAQLAAERLNKHAEAIALYRQLLDLDPSKVDALDALEKLAERAKDYATLADVLERRVAAVSDDAGRLAVLQKLGMVYAEQLADPTAAARTWRRVLELSPGHARALRTLRDSYLAAGDYAALEALYADQNDWDALAEVLSGAADKAREPAQKIELSYRAAAVFEEKLLQPERAVRSYERVLATDPTDARAAERLIPLYERDEKWARLPALYEVRLAQADDLGQKLELLGKLVEVTGTRLNDKKSAVAFARRAYDAAPEREEALGLLESTARAAGAWEVFVEALETRLASLGPAAAPAPAEPAKKKKKKGKRGAEERDSEEPTASAEDLRRPLELRLATVYAEELGKVDEAVATFKRLLDSDPSDEEAASALEALLRRADRRDELRWLLELRVTHASDSAARARVLGDWATLEEEVFEAPDRAVALYRRVLELDPADPIALRALPRLLLAAGDVQGAADVIERHRQELSGGDLAEREIELSELYLDKLGRPADALAAAVRALELRDRDPRAMAVLERLLQDVSIRAQAAAVLADAWAASGDAAREASAIEIMLGDATDRARRLDLYARLTDVREEKLGAYPAALEVALRAAREYPEELSLWERADSLSTLANQPAELAEAYKVILGGRLPPELDGELAARAASLHEDRLGDPLGATPYLERVLALDPSNTASFKRLKDILTAAERWPDLEALYDRASAATEDPARRADMLVEVALVCEDIIEDPAKATRYYERILDIDPLHETASRALERLYGRQERHADLARLLERRLEGVVGDDLLDLKLRLARLQLERLSEPARAVAHVSDVLSERVGDPDARELAEKLLAVPAQRAEAARLLETVYEARDESPDLARVLTIRLEELDKSGATGDAADDDRRALLRRIAALRDERMRDDGGAMEVLARLVPADPMDASARDRLLEIGRRMGAHERVADVLVRAAEGADTPGLRGEILMRVASIYEDLLGDVARAEATYDRILALDPDDAELVLPAARAVERIYIGRADHKKLADILRVQVALEQDGNARRALYGRLGDLGSSVLGDAAGAIAAWRARLDDDPSDEEALAALDRLYEETRDFASLVAILEKRRELSDDRAFRRTLSVRIATRLGEDLGNTAEAIEAWTAAVDEFGADADSFTALEKLYAAANRWDELGDTYERHLDIAHTDAERLEILAKLGDLRREHQANVDGAIEAYKHALTLDTAHGPSRAALETLLGSEDPSTRREAASILHPIYETDGDHERLLRVLDIEVGTSEDTADRLEGLEKAMRVAEGPIGDAGRAFSFAERGLREAVGNSELGPWIEHLERLASASSRQAEYVKILSAVQPDIFDPDVQLAVTLRVADLARHQLADRDLARRYYQMALELRSDDRSALVALESLYEEAGDAPRLLEILERRAEAAEGDDEKKQLMFRRARLHAEVLGDKRHAIEVYEGILEIGLDPSAVLALEKLYEDEAKYSDLVDLFQRQLDASQGDAPALHVKIAHVAAAKQGDFGRAFDELERALDLAREHAGAILELERLMLEAPELEQRARAAALLEPVYLLRTDYDRVMGTLRARLDHSQDPEERRDLLTRLAQLFEEQKEDYLSALETMARLLHEDTSSEGTIAELERLAKVAGAERRLAEVYAQELAGDEPLEEATARLARRAGELFQSLGDGQQALGFYRRALAFEPENRSLFEAVDGILSSSGAAADRVELHRSALEHRFDDADRLATLHVIAELQRGPLASPDDAIETYKQALDVSEHDARSLDALAELYRARARWSDLAELYLRRAEGAPSPAEQAPHRLALARLYRAELQDVERAIDQLEAVVSEEAGNGDAIRELESLRDDPAHKERVVEILRPLYALADDWRHLIKLNEDRFALAQDASEKVAVLRETATLWETRGGDATRARRALGVAVRLGADDDEARADYERLVEATGAWDELAETYEVVLEEQPELSSRRDLLAKLAEVHDTRRDDPRRALDALDRLRAADESDLAPLEKIDQLATLLSDWPTLVRALTAKVELIFDDGERASLWRRIGEAKRDMLEDQEGAVAAYERALELESDSAFTVDCLLDLYEQRSNPERLVELYQRRVELTDEDDAELRYTLLVGSAKVLEEKLQDRGRAIEVLNQALAVRPGDAAVFARLNALFRAESMWQELLDNLRLQASAAADSAARVAIRREIGEILASRLESYPEAVEAYREVLDEAPGDDVAIAAVRRLAQEHEELRENVAAILVPVLRGAERHADLVDVLELRLTTETDASQRCETLRTIAETEESRLSRPSAALAALLRALGERPDLADLHADAERLAGASDGWRDYADTLAARAGATFDAELARDLFSRLGRVAEERLSDARRALDAYVKAVEQAGDQPDLLAALDRLYEQLGEHERLADVLERRMGAESDGAVQAELAYRTGRLAIERFSDPARGIASLRQALDRAPNHSGASEELEKLMSSKAHFEEAGEILEGVYRARGDTQRLASLFEKRVGFADSAGARVEMRKSLARVLEDEGKDAAAAQRVLEQGLADDPADQQILDEIERLAPATGNWASAAAALGAAIQGRANLTSDLGKELSVRLATWQRDRVGDLAASEASLVRALGFAPEADEVWVLLEQLQRAADGRDRDLVETLRRRARLQSDDAMRDQLYQSAFDFAREAKDDALAEAVLRELLERDDANVWALDQLIQLREAAGDFKDTFKLLVRRSEVGADGAEVRRLRHRAAAIAQSELSDVARAIEIYEALFEDEPGDTEASAALRAAYDKTSRWEALGRLLERLVDQAESVEARSTLRIELARLNDTRFKLQNVAIDLLSQVIDDDPSRGEAVVYLSELYETLKRDDDLAELLSRQIDAAKARGDAGAELTFKVRLGEVYESRLGDRARAIETYQGVLEREPSHRGALEALARLYVAGNQLTEAAATLDRLLAQSSGEDAVKLAGELADVHERLADKPAAARALARGLEAERGSAPLRSRLRALYESMGAWAELADLVVGDAELTSGDDQVRFLRTAADIHAQKRNDHAAAADLLDRASKLRPDDRELLLALCDAYSASGRGKAAAEVLEKIVESYGGKRTKELGEIHRRLATAYLADNDTKRALEELDKAFRIEPGNVAVLKQLGEVAMLAAEYQKAQQMYRALLLQKLDDKSPITKAEVFFQLGEVHLALGEKPKAIQNYERAVQTDPSLERAKVRLAEAKA